MTASQTIAATNGKSAPIISGAVKPGARPPRQTSDEVAASVAKSMAPGGSMTQKQATARQDKIDEDKQKESALAAKNDEQQKKLLEEAAEQGKQANSLTENVVKQSQELVRLQFAYKKADTAEKNKIKNQALAIGVLLLEDTEKAMAPLKASKSAMLGRMKSIFEWNPAEMHAIVKERKKPKAQFELDLGLSRGALDAMHNICESNGAPRITQDEATKQKAKGGQMAAAGPDSA